MAARIMENVDPWTGIFSLMLLEIMSRRFTEKDRTFLWF